MARYIDADALKLDIDLSKGATVLDFALSVIKSVKEAPTADVVEVVRCKDCAYREHFYPEKQIGEEAREAYYCGIRKTTVRATDFCSYGERKEK